MPRRAVIFGGPSPEHDISVLTGLQATHVLEDVEAIYWDKSGRFHAVDPGIEAREFADGVPRRSRELTFVAEPGGGFLVKGKKPLDIAVVVNCCHGGPGEDGSLQGAFDLVGYRYSGPGQWGSALGMDKLSFGAAVVNVGLPSLPRTVLTPERPPPFEGPYIVKPRFGGSSIGIEVVDDHATAVALLSGPTMADGAVIEPFLPDCRDLQIAVVTHPEVTLSAIEEPVRSSSGLYSYQQKYLAWGEGSGIARHLPATLEPDLERLLRRYAVEVARLVGVRSVARIDFLERGGELWVNEINTIPGSLAAYLWIDPPTTRRRLLDGIITELEQSRPRRFSTAGADGTALRSAGTIASKLG